MTNGSRTKVDASPFDSQTPAAFEHLANDVLVVVVDLLPVGFLGRAKGDQAAGELLFFKAVDVADLGVEFCHAL